MELDNHTKIDLSVEIPSHQIQSALFVYMDNMKKDIEKAIKNTVKDFDYEGSIRNAFINWMGREIQESVWAWLNSNRNEIINGAVDRILSENFKIELKNKKDVK